MPTIDQLPGGAQLAALAAQLDSFQPSGVESISSALRTAGERVSTTSSEISKAVSDVDTDSSGQATDQFVAYMRPFEDGLTSAGTAMTKAPGLIGQVADQIAGARSEVDRIIADLLAAVPAGQAASPQVTGLVQDATSRATQAVQSRISALSGVAEQLAALATLSPKLSDLHAPDGTSVPASNLGVAPTHLDSAPATPAQPLQSAPATPAAPASPAPSPQLFGAHPALHPEHHGGGAGASEDISFGGSEDAPSGPLPSGDVGDWIKQAMNVLEQNGVPADKLNPSDIALIIQHESDGDPHAVNHTDANAAAGHPSKGLMQTIDSTFQQYTVPGHGDIFNPVDNIISGVRYALAQYGSLDNVPGVLAVHQGGQYVGY